MFTIIIITSKPRVLAVITLTIYFNFIKSMVLLTFHGTLYENLLNYNMSLLIGITVNIDLLVNIK